VLRAGGDGGLIGTENLGAEKERDYSHLLLVFKGALQLLMNRYGTIHFAQVPERVSTKSFVVLMIGNSKSNHVGAQGTFKYRRLRRRGVFLFTSSDVFRSSEQRAMEALQVQKSSTLFSSLFLDLC